MVNGQMDVNGRDLDIAHNSISSNIQKSIILLCLLLGKSEVIIAL